MKVDAITGVADKQVKIYKPVSGVMITKDGNIADEKIEITRVNGRRGEVETICPRMKLADHFEISAHGEGLFIDSNAGSRGLIAVGIAGAANLDDQRYLEIDLSGLAAGSNYVVYGMEEGEIVERVIVYNPIIINADEVNRDFGLQNQEFVALPIANLEKVELVMSGGQTISWTPEELKAKMEIENDICCLHYDGNEITMHYGYRNLALLDVSAAQVLKIHKTAGNAYGLTFIDQA
nr:hypothetical protein [uncultured Draconibacterium sp.]